MSCPHDDFHAIVNVNRMEDTGRFMVELRVSCSECGKPFQFLGLPLGLDMCGAAMDVDGQEARLAIAPVGDIPHPLKGDPSPLLGFRIPKRGQN